MKERPILFSAPMARALLDGSKTQTRRVVKKQATDWDHFAPEEDVKGREFFMVCGRPEQDNRSLRPILAAISCTYGQPGDRLWVRETWGVVSNDWDADGNLTDWTPDRPATAITEMRFGQGYYSGHAIYAADGSYEWAGDDDGGGVPRSAWHPSIHMPRAASRILLEIVSLRVERLQDISEDDAIAEGIEPNWIGDLAAGPNGFGGQGWVPDCGWRHYLNSDDGDPAYTPVASYRSLWESINGAGSWDANPWVWVVEFKRVTP
jgi:hypothetical protein